VTGCATLCGSWCCEVAVLVSGPRLFGFGLGLGFAIVCDELVLSDTCVRVVFRLQFSGVVC
jgi:hypothetical protein